MWLWGHGASLIPLKAVVPLAPEQEAGPPRGGQRFKASPAGTVGSSWDQE